MKKIFLEFLGNVLCFCGFHNMKNANPHVPSPKAGESIAFSNLHKCTRCPKEQMLGMGVVT